MTGFFIILSVLTATLNASAAERSTITLSGSSTVAPVMTEIAARFEKLHKNVRVDVQSGGSSKGITDAREGAVTIGMASRALKPDETDLNNYQIAMDGIAVIVNKANTIQNLTKAQIVGVYKGEIKNWKDLGGLDAPIVVVNKAEGRSTLELFLHYTGLKNSEIKASTIIGENEEGIKLVAGNKNAVAYVSIGTSEVAAKSGIAIKLLNLEGKTASIKTVKDGTYPLTRPLNLVIRKTAKLDSSTEEFLRFATSKDVADIVTGNSFVPVHIQ